MFDTPGGGRASWPRCRSSRPTTRGTRTSRRCPCTRTPRRMIASIGADKSLGYNLDMGFIIVPPGPEEGPGEDPRVPGRVRSRPLPGARQRAHRELAAAAQRGHRRRCPRPGQTLEDLQRHGTGDRHIILVDPVNGLLHEFWQARRTDAGWEASNEATFNLKHRRAAARALDVVRRRRPAHLPGRRALRRVRAGHGRARHALHGAPDAPRLRPARHALGEPAARTRTCRAWASASGLRKDFDVCGFPPHAQAILKGLKTYGMFVADNGSDWLMSIAPDRRLAGPGDPVAA